MHNYAQKNLLKIDLIDFLQSFIYLNISYSYDAFAFYKTLLLEFTISLILKGIKKVLKEIGEMVSFHTMMFKISEADAWFVTRISSRIISFYVQSTNFITQATILVVVSFFVNKFPELFKSPIWHTCKIIQNCLKWFQINFKSQSLADSLFC